MDIKHRDVEVLSIEDVDPNTVTTPFEIPAPKLPKGKQPRNLQDRSKYMPHQGKSECGRRVRQANRMARKRQWGFDPLDCDLPYPEKPVPTEQDMIDNQLAANALRASRPDLWFDEPCPAGCQCICCEIDSEFPERAAEDRQDPPATEEV